MLKAHLQYRVDLQYLVDLHYWVDLQYRFTSNFFARGAYRYVKATDDDPYLYDLSGRNNLLYFSLGYLF